MEATESHKRNWRMVKLAPGEECNSCGESWCAEHKMHYHECPCIGPHQDDEYDYKEEGGVLYAARKETI